MVAPVAKGVKCVHDGRRDAEHLLTLEVAVVAPSATGRTCLHEGRCGTECDPRDHVTYFALAKSAELPATGGRARQVSPRGRDRIRVHDGRRDAEYDLGRRGRARYVWHDMGTVPICPEMLEKFSC